MQTYVQSKELDAIRVSLDYCKFLHRFVKGIIPFAWNFHANSMILKIRGGGGEGG